MDKRTVIGIIILAAILILMPYYQKLISGDQPEVSESDTLASADIDQTHVSPDVVYDSTTSYTPELFETEEDTSSRDASLGGRDDSDTIFSPMDTLPEQLVFVKTGKTDFILSSYGGDIVSAISSEFLDIDGKPLQYCPSEIEGQNFLITAYSGKERITSEALRFIADEDSLILTENDSTGVVTFATMLPGGGMLQRRYHFRFDDYAFEHTTIFGEEVTGEQKIEESVLWWRKGLEPADPDIKGNVSANYRIGYMMGNEYEDEKFSSDEKPQLSFDGSTQFVATHNKYFAVIIAPVEGVASGLRGWGIWYSAESFGDEKRQVPALGVGLVCRGEDNPVLRHDLVYLGPRDYGILKEHNRDFEKTVNLGWSWLQPLTKAFMWVFEFLFGLFGNYGVVIVVFSVLIKLLLLPLSRKQMQSMKKMKDLEPKMTEIRGLYKDDAKRLNEETMKLYKKEGVNPMSGCLPLLPQMPVFFALFALLRNSFALRGAPFMLWLTDLSLRDPYYILPILMSITMFIQQKITVRDPKQKMMVYFMPIFFLFIFRNMPSGLVLYWFTFNVFSLAQTIWVEREKSTPQLADA